MRVGEMKVYDGVESIDGKEVRVIIAATSRLAAVTALEQFGIGISVRRLVTYWTVTSNRQQCEVALSKPGQAFANIPGSNGYEPLPHRALPPKAGPVEPRVPKDPEGRRVYDKVKREDSDASKRARGERRLSTWIPKEAAEALDRLTGGNTSRGAVQAALVQALLSCAGKQATAKQKAA